MTRRQSTDVDQQPAAGREAPLLHAVRTEFGCGENFRLLRSNTGVAKYCSRCESIHRKESHPSYRIVRFGIPGAPDASGILAPLGRVIAIETKSDDGTLDEEQANYHAMITKYGGLVCVVRSIEEAREWMKGVGARW